MRLLLLSIMVGLLSGGCVNMTTRLQPEDSSVPAAQEGSDCIPMIFGVAIGTATVEAAQLNARKPNHASPSGVPINKTRRVEWSDYGFLGFGARCVEVAGE